MSTSYAKIKAQAKALPERQRRKLASELYDDPWAIFAPEVRADWAEELRRRDKQLMSGKMKTYSSEEVFAELRKRLR